MKIFHLSAECYPAAKAGGLADVVGSLPKYLRSRKMEAAVVMPRYATDWIGRQQYETVFEGSIPMGYREIAFRMVKEAKGILGFPLYMVDIPLYFDRESIYVDPRTGAGYEDEAERFIAFQKAALQWIKSLEQRPDIIHCHDHHTGLVPFMMTQAMPFRMLESIPTVLTVHNAEYQGIYGHEKQQLLPPYNLHKSGLLDWDGMLNSLAAGLKCCWQITTVSPSYMRELRNHSSGLERLFAHEKQKSRGILNGIDTNVWDPQADTYLDHHYSADTLKTGKRSNKKELCEQFGLSPDRPLVSFIGRLVGEKGADLLPDLFSKVLDQGREVSFMVLGTGDPELHDRFRAMSDRYMGFFDASLSYNEQLAHQIYAGSDFMVMPSRVEPCGLNQMYAMRYGTVPVVRNIGGLKDTVIDIGGKGGYGFTFDEFSLEAALHAVQRALEWYEQKPAFDETRKRLMKLDFSWNVSAASYIELYKQLIERL